jgi:hypothetical protein
MSTGACRLVHEKRCTVTTGRFNPGWQAFVQASVSTELPSSHASPAVTMPSPQRAATHRPALQIERPPLTSEQSAFA